VKVEVPLEASGDAVSVKVLDWPITTVTGLSVALSPADSPLTERLSGSTGPLLSELTTE
jgi:hypothetical protein